MLFGLDAYRNIFRFIFVFFDCSQFNLVASNDARVRLREHCLDKSRFLYQQILSAFLVFRLLLDIVRTPNHY